MTEIWVPYGPVEVSFDIKQENLSQVLEPKQPKLSQEEFEKKALESSGANSVLILSQTPGTQKVLDMILSKNKEITRILHPRHLGALARRKAQEFIIADVELFEPERLVEAGIVDSASAKISGQLKESSNLVILTSVHYDPLFGLTSAASDMVSLNFDLKSQAFKRSIDELPCSAGKSNASWYATRLLQTSPNLNVIEVVERNPVGVLNFFTGEPEVTHAKTLDFWKKALSVSIPARHERILFGCGGLENDRTLAEAMARSFFNIATNVALKDSDSKICMLAECSQGLGSEALLRYVAGNFIPGASLDTIQYFEGLEILLSFTRVHNGLDISMVSTLPEYYASRLDLKTLSAARDAPSSVVSQNSRAKILVIPDASAAYFTEPG